MTTMETNCSVQPDNEPFHANEQNFSEPAKQTKWNALHYKAAHCQQYRSGSRPNFSSTEFIPLTLAVIAELK